MEIRVLPPDINESFDNFTLIPPRLASRRERPAQPAIRFGLAAIKNVGHNVVKAIVEERKKNGIFQTMADFLTRLAPPAGQSTMLIKNLWKV